MSGTKKIIFQFYLLFFINSVAAIDSLKKIIIITASYNNQMWVSNYFESLKKQTYQNWVVIYIDDCSTDQTFSSLQEYIKEAQLDSKFILIHNEERMGHLFNQYHAIHACNPNNLILILDGDDWLAHEQVLEEINKIYQDETIWLTYGQFWYFQKNKKGFCKEIPFEVIENNGIRDISWRTSHPRTFYAGLFQQIKLEDLWYEGNFLPKCADVATMFPMIEMAGEHIKFIPEVLYIYNDANPLSYHHDPTHQRAIEAYLRTLPRYQKLECKPW